MEDMLNSEVGNQCIEQITDEIFVEHMLQDIDDHDHGESVLEAKKGCILLHPFKEQLKGSPHRRRMCTVHGKRESALQGLAFLHQTVPRER